MSYQWSPKVLSGVVVYVDVGDSTVDDELSFDDVAESNPEPESVADRTETTNEAGGVAYGPDSAEFGLYKLVLNNLLEDSYYDTAEESFEKLRDRFQAVAETNPEFALQLATYARQEGGYRDIAQMLLVLAANDERTKPFVRDYTPAIIDRTDEFNTVVSYQLRGAGKPIPKPLKKGIEDALHKRWAVIRDEETDETERVTWIEGEDELPVSGKTVLDSGYSVDTYTAAKYLQRNKQVSLYDVLNLVHPTPRSENRDELFGRIVRGELDDHDDEPLREERTWESTRSDDEDERSEAEQWRDRIEDMGLLARLRNLRNMRQAGLDGEEIFGYDAPVTFGDRSAELVRDSKLFPFRYYQAYKACADVRYGNQGFSVSTDELDAFSQQWLESAMDASVQNLPDTLENTFVAVDVSGSMNSPVSSDSELMCAEIGTLFGAMLLQRGCDVGVFAMDVKRLDVDQDQANRTDVFDLAQQISEAGSSVGGSTNAWKVFQNLSNAGLGYERVVMLTDMQVWDSSSAFRSRSFIEEWDRYTESVAPEPNLYTIDLQSYGDLVMPEGYHNVHQISGWSTDVIEFIDRNERAGDVIAEIETIDHDDY